ncbi:HU family DNA-binding protein, partial [Parabacteroides goldsteinii]
MNKTQIVRMLAERLDITLVDSRIYLNTLLDIVVEGVITDEKVGIHEFGKIFILPQ